MLLTYADDIDIVGFNNWAFGTAFSGLKKEAKEVGLAVNEDNKMARNGGRCNDYGSMALFVWATGIAEDGITNCISFSQTYTQLSE